ALRIGITGRDTGDGGKKAGRSRAGRGLPGVERSRKVEKWPIDRNVLLAPRRGGNGVPTRFEELMGCRPDFGITADKQPHTGPGSKNGDVHCWWWLRYATLFFLFVAWPTLAAICFGIRP